MQTFTYIQAEKLDFNSDILDEYNDAPDSGITGKIVEATAQELANLKVGSICGAQQNTCFQNIAAKYPDLKVRGFISEELGEMYNFCKGTKNQTLAGQVVVFTGELYHLTRAEATELVEERGGKVENAVTKRTTLLVATKVDGLKYKKASKLGITIWDEDTFFTAVDRFKEILIGSIDAFISSDAQGEDIARLAEAGGGSFRYDDAGAPFIPPAGSWRYFETE